ncbi:MAG: DUF5074 domain-containing protein [Rikenellaceae bacterium]
MTKETKKSIRWTGAVMSLMLTGTATTSYAQGNGLAGITEGYDPKGEIKGFFVLNEGNMGSNKATLDYFDYTTGIYHKNIYAERNPTVTKELGDVGNDLQIYEDRLYAVINCSNLVEVMELSTAVHIGSFSIPNCRFIVFSGSYAFVSSYAGELQGSSARLGYVAKVDLNSLEVVAECSVGYQPEEMVIVGDKLYVANSGGYMWPDYDTTISVIDLESFEQVEQIEVAVNLYHVELDPYGYIWVSSRGDSLSTPETPSAIYLVDPSSSQVVKSFDLPNNNMTLAGDLLYVLGEEGCTVIDTQSQEIIVEDFITDETFDRITVPYGVAFNQEYQELIITDADDYVTPGKLHCYAADGTLRWSVAITGDIPSSVAFTNVGLEF